MNAPARDATALAALWVRTYDPLVRLAWLLVGDKAAAEDLVSATFLRMFTRLDDLDDPGPYLRRAVINAARTHWRHEDAGRRAHARLTVHPELDSPLVELVDVLAQLPDKQRAVIVLRHLYGYDDAEIADLLCCRQSTVRSHARHALTKLREVLP